MTSKIVPILFYQGVGAFEFCLNGLKRKKLLGCLEEVVLENKNPFSVFALECKCWQLKLREWRIFWPKLDKW